MLSLCRWREKRSKDSYPADERIVHLPTVSLDQCFVLLTTESLDQWFVLLTTESLDQWFVLLPTKSLDQWFVHLPDTGLWILFHVTCIGSVLGARGNRNDSFISRLGLCTSLLDPFSRDLHSTNNFCFLGWAYASPDARPRENKQIFFWEDSLLSSPCKDSFKMNESFTNDTSLLTTCKLSLQRHNCVC